MTETEEALRLPEDILAERSLLATLCGAGADPAEHVAHLQEEDFVHPLHRAIFRALRDLVQEGAEVHLVSLRDRIRARGEIGKVGGSVEISEVLGASEVGSPAALVALLERKRRLRELMRAASGLLRDAAWETDTAEALVARYLAPLEGPAAGGVLEFHAASEYLDVPVPEQAWIVPGLVPRGEPQVLASQAGLGKSWLALQLLVAVATGKPFLDFPAQPPRGAIYFGLEDSRPEVMRRLQRIVAHYRFVQDWSVEDDALLRANLEVVTLNWGAASASSYLPDLVPSLAARLARCSVEPGLLVLDTLSRFSAGDENSVEFVRPLLGACHRLIHLGWTPILLHHTSKGQDGARTAKAKDKPGISDRMSPEWVRGSSALVGNFRCVQQLASLREDEAERIGLDGERARRRDFLVFGATKSSAPVAEWRLVERSEHGPWFTPPNYRELMAQLHGPRAMAALSKQLAILVDLYHATRYGQDPDRDGLAKKHCGESKDPIGAFRTQLRKLRGAGFIQKDGLALTILGLQRVRDTGGDTERTTDDN